MKRSYQLTRTTGPRKWCRYIGPKRRNQLTRITGPRIWCRYIGPKRRYQLTRTTGPRMCCRYIGPKRRYQLTRATGPRIWGLYVGPKRRHQLTSFVEGEHAFSKKKRIINYVQNLRTCLLANFSSSLRLFGTIFAHNILMFKSAVKNPPPPLVSLPFPTLSAIRNA